MRRLRGAIGAILGACVLLGRIAIGDWLTALIGLLDPPHVCGGRGRCSTCRIRILGDLAGLPAPSATEQAVRERVHVSPGVRLACQLRPTRSIATRTGPSARSTNSSCSMRHMNTIGSLRPSRGPNRGGWRDALKTTAMLLIVDSGMDVNRRAKLPPDRRLKIDPFLASHDGSGRPGGAGWGCAAGRARIGGLISRSGQARFLKRQLSFPVSTMSQW